MRAGRSCPVGIEAQPHAELHRPWGPPCFPRSVSCRVSTCLCRPFSGCFFRSFRYFCSLLLRINLFHESSSGGVSQSPGLPADSSGCSVPGDGVPEEEGQVREPGVAAHRHFGAHGPAAAPGQLRGAQRAPAGSPARECGCSPAGSPCGLRWVRCEQAAHMQRCSAPRAPHSPLHPAQWSPSGTVRVLVKAGCGLCPFPAVLSGPSTPTAASALWRSRSDLPQCPLCLLPTPTPPASVQLSQVLVCPATCL